MKLQVNLDLVLVTVDCAECGMVFAIPERLRDGLQANRGRFYCPAGHNLWFGPGAIEEQKKEIKRLKEQLRREQVAVEAADRRAAAYKGHFTRVKKRVGHGVCPVCRRYFKAMDEHMQSQHPGYADDA